MSDHIGVTGNAMYRGIPAITVSWTGTAARTLTVHNLVEKSAEADVKESAGNDGEVVEMNRTNKKFKVRIEAKPVGTAKADALAIANDLPQKMDILTIAGETQLAASGSTCVCDGASAKWSPTDELTVSIDATVWLSKSVVAFS
jgi:hypothetical protein